MILHYEKFRQLHNSLLESCIRFSILTINFITNIPDNLSTALRHSPDVRISPATVVVLIPTPRGTPTTDISILQTLVFVLSEELVYTLVVASCGDFQAGEGGWIHLHISLLSSLEWKTVCVVLIPWKISEKQNIKLYDSCTSWWIGPIIHWNNEYFWKRRTCTYILDTNINHYPATIFVPKKSSAFTSAAYIQVHIRLYFFHGNKQYEPWSDCSPGSSLIWVNIVCNIGYLKYKQMRKQQTSCDWLEKGLMILFTKDYFLQASEFFFLFQWSKWMNKFLCCFECKIVNIFLSMSFNFFLGCSIELSHPEGSFEYLIVTLCQRSQCNFVNAKLRKDWKLKK